MEKDVSGLVKGASQVSNLRKGPLWKHTSLPSCFGEGYKNQHANFNEEETLELGHLHNFPEGHGHTLSIPVSFSLHKFPSNIYLLKIIYPFALHLKIPETT